MALDGFTVLMATRSNPGPTGARLKGALARGPRAQFNGGLTAKAERAAVRRPDEAPDRDPVTHLPTLGAQPPDWVLRIAI
ncbi:MAG: hypothetical protein M3280_08850 [Actinomycetota bacterium]|nr:hypothetical protein [Actinomycetota bacterium]